MGCVSGLSELIQAQFPTRYYPVYYNQRCSYLADQSVGKYTRINMETTDDCVFVTGKYLMFYLMLYSLCMIWICSYFVTFTLVVANGIGLKSPG